MAKFGDVLFSGSRFIFWVASAIVLLFVILTPFFPGPWSLQSVLLVVGVDLTGILLVLALYNPNRFRWAGRVAAGLVFTAYVLYFLDEASSGKPWRFGRRSEDSPLNGLLGLLVIGFPCLRYAWVGRFGSNKDYPVHTPEDAAAYGLRKMLGRCPACSTDFVGHSFTLFASTVARKEDVPRVTEFINEAKAQDWKALGQFKEFDASSNDLLAYVIRCASGGTLILVRSPFELYENDEVVMIDRIITEKMAEVSRLVQPGNWHPLSPNTAAAQGEKDSSDSPVN